MTPNPSVRRRVRIDRLEIDLRGIATPTAQAAARALGPALARALAPHRGDIGPAGRIDAGAVASPASAGANDLAASLAERIAAAARRGTS